LSLEKNYSLESKNRPAKEKTKPMKTSLKRIVFENTLAKTKPKKSSQMKFATQLLHKNRIFALYYPFMKFITIPLSYETFFR